MYLNQPNQNSNQNHGKYKTMLCKHFNSPKGCSFGDKCQFAHGTAELRTGGIGAGSKKGPNPQNYKIVKCKYWEKDGTCRYGTLCSFAHGDDELRTKSENLVMHDGSQSMPPQSPQMYGMGNPYMMGFDPNLMMMHGMMNFPQGDMGNMGGMPGMPGMPGMFNGPQSGMGSFPPMNKDEQK